MNSAGARLTARLSERADASHRCRYSVCVLSGREWSVRLSRTGTLYNTIVADTTRLVTARHEMVTCLREPPIILSGERADE
jgi:hypothetical protein